MSSDTNLATADEGKALFERFAAAMKKAGHVVEIVYEGGEGDRSRMTIDGVELQYIVWRTLPSRPLHLRIFSGRWRRDDLAVPKTNPKSAVPMAEEALQTQREWLVEKAKIDAVEEAARRLRERFGGVLPVQDRNGSAVVVIDTSTYGDDDEPCVTLRLGRLRGTPEQIEAVLAAAVAAGLIQAP